MYNAVCADKSSRDNVTFFVCQPGLQFLRPQGAALMQAAARMDSYFIIFTNTDAMNKRVLKGFRVSADSGREACGNASLRRQQRARGLVSVLHASTHCTQHVLSGVSAGKGAVTPRPSLSRKPELCALGQARR